MCDKEEDAIGRGYANQERGAMGVGRRGRNCGVYSKGALGLRLEMNRGRVLTDRMIDRSVTGRTDVHDSSDTREK